MSFTDFLLACAGSGGKGVAEFNCHSSQKKTHHFSSASPYFRVQYTPFRKFGTTFQYFLIDNQNHPFRAWFGGCIILFGNVDFGGSGKQQ